MSHEFFSNIFAVVKFQKCKNYSINVVSGDTHNVDDQSLARVIIYIKNINTHMHPSP